LKDETASSSEADFQEFISPEEHRRSKLNLKNLNLGNLQVTQPSCQEFKSYPQIFGLD